MKIKMRQLLITLLCCTAAVSANAVDTILALQLHAHHVQSMALFLGEIEEVDTQHSVKPLRWQFVHADTVGRAEIDRACKLGMALSVFGSMMLSAPQYHAVLGDRTLDMPPLRLIQYSGIRYGLGTDATAEAVHNPFVTMWWAVTGKGIHGRQVTRQLLTREEVLIAYTRNAAYLVFEENNLGSIEPGKLADLVVLDRDFLGIAVDEIRDVQQMMVMMGGKTVFQR